MRSISLWCENKNSTNIQVRKENKYSTLTEQDNAKYCRRITKLDIVVSQHKHMTIPNKRKKWHLFLTKSQLLGQNTPSRNLEWSNQVVFIRHITKKVFRAFYNEKLRSRKRKCPRNQASSTSIRHQRQMLTVS